jgi:hypothetical protein
MTPGALVLFWEAQGTKQPSVKGLYGWGITLDEPQEDFRGQRRIQIRYVERWVSASDAANIIPESEHAAAIPGEEVLSLPSWENHLLATMPAGTNFIVTPTQLLELTNIIVRKRYPTSELPRAALEDAEGKRLIVEQFTAQRIMEVRPDGS